jgi:hypothetical protein
MITLPATAKQLWDSFPLFDRIALFPHFDVTAFSSSYENLSKSQQESIQYVFEGDLS